MQWRSECAGRRDGQRACEGHCSTMPPAFLTQQEIQMTPLTPWHTATFLCKITHYAHYQRENRGIVMTGRETRRPPCHFVHIKGGERWECASAGACIASHCAPDHSIPDSGPYSASLLWNQDGKWQDKIRNSDVPRASRGRLQFPLQTFEPCRLCQVPAPWASHHIVLFLPSRSSSEAPQDLAQQSKTARSISFKSDTTELMTGSRAIDGAMYRGYIAGLEVGPPGR